MLIRIQTFYNADPDPTLSEMNRDEPYLINSQALSVRGHKAGAGRVGEGAQHCRGGNGGDEGEGGKVRIGGRLCKYAYYCNMHSIMQLFYA